jgi:hypothetical protein
VTFSKRDFYSGMLAAVLIPLVVVALFIPSALLNAWALRILWGWFITPEFGLAVPGYWMAAGLSMTVRFVTSQYSEDHRKWNEKMMYSISLPLFAVLFGWIVHALAVR